MNANSLWRGPLAAAILLLTFSACSGDDDSKAADAGHLRYVPADSPYVIAMNERLDDEILEAFEPHVDEILAGYRELLRNVVEAARADAEDTDAAVMSEIDDFSGAIDALAALLSVDGMEQAGIPLGARMILYGNGLLPVLRIELSDPALFEQAIAHIEQEAGQPMLTAKLGETTYRYVGDDDARVLITTIDGYAVLTLAPSTFDDEQLRRLLGLDLPAKSLATTDVLGTVAKQYGYTQHYIGYVDTIRLVDAVLEPTSDLDTALLAGTDFDPSIVSSECKAEIREMAGIAPRMVFGYDHVGLDAFSGGLVVELRSDLAKALTGVSNVVPGLGKDEGGALSFGASVNVKALRDFYAARLDAMEADPYECEYFAELQAGTAKGREILAQPIPPVVYGVRGFNAVLESLDGIDIASGQPPENVDASFVLAMDDASALVAMGMMFSPELAALNLQPDGKPVELALPQVSAVAQEAYAAMVDTALAVAVGDGAEQRVARVLNAPSGSPSPVFALAMDAGEYYRLIAEGMVAAPQDGVDELTIETQETARRIMLKLADIYDRMSVEVRFIEQGAEVRSRVTLKDL